MPRAAAGKIVCRHKGVADYVLAGPADGHLALRRPFEEENIWPRLSAVHVFGSTGVDEKVCGINAADGLAQDHLAALQGPHAPVVPLHAPRPSAAGGGAGPGGSL